MEMAMAVGEFARLLGFLFGTLGFIIFVVLDIREAFNKGVHWVPARALVLNVLTIQIMIFLEEQSDQALLGQNSLCAKTLEDGEVGKNNFIMIHSTRVMLCVLVALFLPGMARIGSPCEKKWTKIAALGLTVFIDIFSELLTLYHRFAGLSSSNGVSWFSFMVSDVLISISLLWLILLLICATRASKSIRNITAQRIPFILAEPGRTVESVESHVESVDHRWEGIKNQILKSWIVVCVCDPQSIIAKSVVASSASLVVTICIISSVVGWILRGPKTTLPGGAESWLKLMITILEVVFILIGWAVLLWRSLTSIRYYGRWEETSWFSQFLVEDFWTQKIREELKEEESKGRFRIEEIWTKFVEAKESERKLKDKGNFLDNIPVIAKRKKLLLKCVFFLQLIVVFFSKISHFVIVVTFYNGRLFFRKIVSLVLTEDNENEGFAEYEEILKNVTIGGETPETVFATNRKALKRARKLWEDGGKEIGNDLINFLSKHETLPSPSCKDETLPTLRLGVRGPLDPKETGLELFCKIDSDKLKEEKFFSYMSERSWSWKLTAVALINIIVSLSPQSQLYFFRVYVEAWQLLDLVDEWDPDSDSLLRRAADREFNTLVERWLSDSSPVETLTMEDVVKEINELAKTKKTDIVGESDKEDEEKQSIPVNWEKFAAAIAIYKLCKAMDCRSGNFQDPKNEVERLLAHVIACGIHKAGTALVDKCRKWAQDMDEEKLLKAIYIGGKCQAIIKQLEQPIDRTTRV